MKYVAAYALSYISGNTQPSVADITEILESIGADIDKKRIEDILTQVNGVNITQVIKEKLSEISSSGAKETVLEDTYPD